MSVVSGVVSATTSKSSADKQADSAKSAQKIQWNMYKQNREDMAPWREAGKAAINTLLEKVKAGPGDYTKSPGYAFRLAEGNKQIGRSAAAKGGNLSGGTLKALTEYGQNYATNDYDNYLNRYYQSLTPWQSIAGVGQTATAQSNNDATNTANAIGGFQQMAANAIASGNTGAANAISNASASGLSNGLQAYYLWKNYGSSGSSGSQAAGYGTAAGAAYGADAVGAGEMEELGAAIL